MTSTSENTNHGIVKSDRIGRTHYTPEYKAEVLAAFEKSGMSGQAFAAHCGIKYPTFASWRTKSRRPIDSESTGNSKPSFILAEVTASDGSSRSGLSVKLPGGAIASVHDEDGIRLLASLIEALN